MSKTPVLYEDGCDEGRELPFKWEICGRCEGHGKSSAYLGAFTRSELAEEGSEFIEDYFAGRYDRCCEACGGTGKVKAPDFDRTSKEDAETYNEQQRSFAEMEAIERQERLMEGGWREEGWFGR